MKKKQTNHKATFGQTQIEFQVCTNTRKACIFFPILVPNKAYTAVYRSLKDVHLASQQILLETPQRHGLRATIFPEKGNEEQREVLQDASMADSLHSKVAWYQQATTSAEARLDQEITVDSQDTFSRK